MYELEQVGKHSFFFHCPSRVGLVETGDGKVCLIDSGSDKDAARRIRKVLDEKGYELTAIYNTHHHADHTGGNRYLQDKTGCRIFAPDTEREIASHSLLEPVSIFAGDPPKDIRNKFFMAKESRIELLTSDVLPDGWEILELPGHSFNMVGYRTCDDVVYLADSIASEETIEKYGVTFLYDVGETIRTLEMVEQMDAAFFVPAHVPPSDDMSGLAGKNIEKIYEIAETIVGFCEQKRNFDELLQHIFHVYKMEMTFSQHALVGSTIRSYLSWLCRESRMEYVIEDNMMCWRSI